MKCHISNSYRKQLVEIEFDRKAFSGCVSEVSFKLSRKSFGIPIIDEGGEKAKKVFALGK